MFARWAPASIFQVDTGVRLAFIEEFRLCVVEPCPSGYGALLGPYAAGFVGSRTFKLGPRVAYVVRMDTGEWGAMLYPLVLRIQFAP